MDKKILMSVSMSIVLLSGIFIVDSIVRPSSATTNGPEVKVYPLNLFCGHIIVSLGDVFTVRVNVTDVPESGLYSFELKVFFNSTILRCLEADFPSNPPYVFHDKHNAEFPPEIDNDEGYVLFAVTLLGEQCWRPPPSRNGYLAQMNFTAIREGISFLSLRDVILVDCDSVPMQPYDNVKVIDSFVDVGSQLPWIYSDCKATSKGGNCSLVATEPEYTTFVFTCPNKIEFAVSVNGTEQCNVTIPFLKLSKNMTIWDGPFKVRVDENRVNYTVSFNATHTFLSFSCNDGVHDIEINEATVMCITGDLDEDEYVGIKDLFILAANFGKHCETP